MVRNGEMVGSTYDLVRQTLPRQEAPAGRRLARLLKACLRYGFRCTRAAELATHEALEVRGGYQPPTRVQDSGSRPGQVRTLWAAPNAAANALGPRASMEVRALSI
jgi:hypothetical protein